MTSPRSLRTVGRWRFEKSPRPGGESDGAVVVRSRPRGALDLEAFFEAPSGDGPLGLPLAAAACSEGIRKDTGVVSWLQWPDLVSIDGKVVGQACFRSPRVGISSARIVVDCFAKAGELSLTPSYPRTSILAVLGVEVDLRLLRDKVLLALDWYLAEWERGMTRKLADRLEPTIPWMGREVEVLTADGRRARGRAVGLDGTGSLVLEGPPRDRLTVGPVGVEFAGLVK